MKKIWGYLAAALAGFLVGLITMYKILGDTVKCEVKNIKNKRVGTSTTTVPINIDAKKERKQRRRSRKNKK